MREFLQFSRKRIQSETCCKKRDINPIQHTFYVEAYNLLIVQIEFTVVVVFLCTPTSVNIKHKLLCCDEEPVSFEVFFLKQPLKFFSCILWDFCLWWFKLLIQHKIFTQIKNHIFFVRITFIQYVLIALCDYTLWCKISFEKWKTLMTY